MRLSNWLSAQKMTDAEFGCRIGKTHTTVMRLKKGIISPSLKTLKSIRDATDGEVVAEDFMNDISMSTTPQASEAA